MPDGDKFERRLWCKGLKRVYRLARENGDLEELTPLLYDAKNRLLRDGLDCPVINEIANRIYGALNSPLFLQMENIRQLSAQLDGISISQNSSLGTRIAVKAAMEVYGQEISKDAESSKAQIEAQLRKQFTVDLLDNQFFARVREGIVEKTQRTYREQVEWEMKLTMAVLSYKRPSNRWLSTKEKEWTRERLDQPLSVLEG